VSTAARGRVSVVIPCFNDGATVTGAVKTALANEGVEVVIVDDGSDDESTPSILSDLAGENVTVIHQERAGVAAARMRGVAETASEYVMALDADDELVEGSLEPLVRMMDDDPDLSVAWGDCLVFGERNRLAHTAADLDPWLLTFQNQIPSAALIRRLALDAAGGWREGGYEDWDLWLALAELGHRGRRFPQPVHRYRYRSNRRYSSDVKNDREIREALRERHKALWDGRPELRRRSSAPALLLAVLPTIERLPLVGELWRRRLQHLLIRVTNETHPRELWRRLRRSRTQSNRRH
jgi:glycosyltransferase involved in cell wall biosynthesis